MMNRLILTMILLLALTSSAWASTSWKIDDTYTFTLSVNGTSGAVDADSVPSYRVYEDETGTAILTGSMAKLDDANTTGYYSEQITLSTANGLEKGKSYNIILCATVSSTTSCTNETFQIEAEVDSNTVSGTVATVTSVTNAVTLPTMPTDWITAGGIADDAGNEIADQVWDEELAAHTTADTPGKVVNMLTQDAVTLSTDVALTSIVGQILDDGTAWSYTAATDSQEAIRDNLGGSAPTAAQIADAVWDEDTTGHNTLDTFGADVTATRDLILPVILSGQAQAGGVSTLTLQAGASPYNDFFKDHLLYLVSGTGGAQARRILSYNGTTKVATVDRSWSVTPDATTTYNVYVWPGYQPIDTGVTLATLQPNYAPATATALTTHDGKLDTLDTVADGIQTDLSNATDGLGALKALIDTVQTDTDDIQTRLPAALVGGKMESNVGSLTDDIITAADIAAGAIGSTEIGEYIFTVVSSADCTNSAVLFDTNLTQVQTDHWKDAFATFTTGTLAGQTKAITAYNGTTKCMTVKSPGFSTTPTAGDTGILVNK